jgi:CheY-like chemotaxis protein
MKPQRRRKRERENLDFAGAAGQINPPNGLRPDQFTRNMARILIADDDPDLRALIQRALTAVGHEVQAAQDGIEALALLRAGPVDVAIVDIYMPGKDGIETIMDLHRRHPGIKVIAITGSAPQTGKAMLAMAQRLGAHLAMAKPFTVEELLAAVSGVLAGPAERPEPPPA